MDVLDKDGKPIAGSKAFDAPVIDSNATILTERAAAQAEIAVEKHPAKPSQGA